MYGCGMRAAETVGLELDSIDLEEGDPRAFGKGSKERLVPLGRDAVAAVNLPPRPRPARAGQRDAPRSSSIRAAGA